VRFAGDQQREADRLRRWAHCQAEVSGTAVEALLAAVSQDQGLRRQTDWAER
jgi:hypothetical protein